MKEINFFQRYPRLNRPMYNNKASPIHEGKACHPELVEGSDAERKSP
jgi:hypothetical protein